jgi:hypothetical protein
LGGFDIFEKFEGWDFAKTSGAPGTCTSDLRIGGIK